MQCCYLLRYVSATTVVFCCSVHFLLQNVEGQKTPTHTCSLLTPSPCSPRQQLPRTLNALNSQIIISQNMTFEDIRVKANDQHPKTLINNSELRNIMEAASALTRFGDEESDIAAPVSPKEEEKAEQPEQETADEPENPAKPAKRFIPEYKKPNAALTFPEKLMHLMAFADKHKNNNFCVSWLSDGKSFVVSNPDEFTRQVLPKYFKATKFTSFTRKLYRWGFRQLNRGIGPDDPIIFGNEFFQRDDAELMTKMRSVTAASNRKEEHSTIQFLAQRRALDAIESEREQKRILFDQLIQQKALNFNNHFNSQSMFAQNPVSGLNLTNALRPGLSPGGFNGFGGSGLKTFDMLGQNNPLMNAFPSMQGNNLRSLSNPSQQYPNTTSHADIVNAAINALRFA